MKNYITNAIEYLKNVAKGEEYISNNNKFVILLEAASIVHVVDCILYGFFSNLPMCFYNIASFLFYQMMLTVAKQKKYKLCVYLCVAEVNLAVLLSALLFGTCLGFNTFSLVTIPLIFYATTTLKDYRHPVVTAATVSGVSAATYIFTNFFQPDSIAAVINGHSGLAVFTMIFNAIVITLLLIVFLLLFTWEVRNNTATLEKRNQQLRQISTKDPLTKLNNRRSMTEHLNLSMQQMRMTKKPFSVILCDIDNFKHVNDTYGHDCGDKVLVMVANIISSQMRESDFVCRWGGEEILIKVEGSQNIAKAIAERIRVTIYGSEVEHEGTKVNVTMTFGVAEANEHQRVEDFIQLADNRLYYGKEHGKNQVVIDIPN